MNCVEAPDLQTPGISIPGPGAAWHSAATTANNAFSFTVRLVFRPLFGALAPLAARTRIHRPYTKKLGRKPLHQRTRQARSYRLYDLRWRLLRSPGYRCELAKIPYPGTDVRGRSNRTIYSNLSAKIAGNRSLR